MATHFHAYCEGMAALEIRWGVAMDNATMERLWVDGLTALLHGLQTSNTSDTIRAAVAATLWPPTNGLRRGFAGRIPPAA